MEPISTAAKQAAAKRDQREYSEEDLADRTGATIGNAYLVKQGEDRPDFVMVVTGMTHVNDEYFLDARGVWRQDHGVSDEAFNRGIRIEAELYRIESRSPGVYYTHDEPFGADASIPYNALHEMKRRRLNDGVKPNAYVHPDVA